jgi:hypothetical protein
VCCAVATAVCCSVRGTGIGKRQRGLQQGACWTSSSGEELTVCVYNPYYGDATAAAVRNVQAAELLRGCAAVLLRVPVCCWPYLHTQSLRMSVLSSTHLCMFTGYLTSLHTPYAHSYCVLPALAVCGLHVLAWAVCCSNVTLCWGMAGVTLLCGARLLCND